MCYVLLLFFCFFFQFSILIFFQNDAICTHFVVWFENVIFLPVIHSYTCFVVDVPSLVLARRRQKFFERTLDFLHRSRRKQFCFLGGSKWCHIYTFFTHPAADENNFVLGVKMVSYILHTRFLHSPMQAKKFGVFVG